MSDHGSPVASGMGDPTSCQYSSQDHLTTQAPPLHQSRDTFGGIYSIYGAKMQHLRNVKQLLGAEKDSMYLRFAIMKMLKRLDILWTMHRDIVAL
jgi:hypothetical protein